MQTQKVDLQFEDLPPEARGRPRGSKYRAKLEALMDHPDRWAVIAEFQNQGSASGLAGALRAGRIQIPSGNFEITTRGSKVYARYRGRS